MFSEQSALPGTFRYYDILLHRSSLTPLRTRQSVVFFFRRTPLVLARPDHGAPFVNAVAQTMAGYLGWSESQKKEEINALQNRLRWEMSAATSS